jgi:DNA-directed RNA polymerase subunit F
MEAKDILYNLETGEVLKEVFEGDKVKVTRKESLDYLSRFETWNLEAFFKGHIGELEGIMKELTTYEKAFLFSIVPKVGYEDCCLKHKNGNVLNQEDLIAISGLSKPTVIKVIKSLIAKGVLYQGRNGKETQYFVNPWLFCKGNRINKVLKTMFRNYKVRVCGGRKWKDLG